MTTFGSEILRIRNSASEQEYDVLLCYHETHGAVLSRLDIEMVPLLAHTKVGSAWVTRACEPLSGKVAFDLELKHPDQRAQFATRRDFLLPAYLHSSGLGSYMLGRLISWGKEIAPAYVFQKLHLSEVDARTEQAKRRRNDFYRAHGFALDFTHDVHERNGSCCAARLDSLAERSMNGAKILSVRPIEQAMHSLLKEKCDLMAKLSSESAEHGKLRADLAVYRASIRRLLLHRYILILLLILFGLGRYLGW